MDAGYRATQVESGDVLKNVDTVYQIKGALALMRKAGAEAGIVHVVSCVLKLDGGFIDTHNRGPRVL